MDFLKFSKRKLFRDSREESTFTITLSSDGITFSHVKQISLDVRDPTIFRSSWDITSLLLQLEDEGYVVIEGDKMLLSWDDAYRLMDSADYGESFSLLGLPPVEGWKPSLVSNGTLTDPEFSVQISAWRTPDGRFPRGNVSVEGALLKAEGKTVLMTKPVWETVRAVSIIQLEQTERVDRDHDWNKRAWALIRSKAIVAGADLSDFLAKTVVLTPEKLDIELRKSAIGAGNVVEVLPFFEGQPDRWIEIFDRLKDVPDKYEIPDGDGLVHVLISPDVRTVLREIKKMPGRRVAGDRAEAFLRNPFSTLGPAATTVIDAEQFEQAREAAGISFARFTAIIRRDNSGYPVEVGLLVEESVAGEIKAERIVFEEVRLLSKFLDKLESRIASGAQCCHWDGFDLEILGDTPEQANSLRAALLELEHRQSPLASELLDLSRYSERIEGFGKETPYYSPYIARKNNASGWFPENVEFGVLYTPEDGGKTVSIPLKGEKIEDFRKTVADAKQEGRSTFQYPGCPQPISVDWAEKMLDTLTKTQEDVGKGTFDPEKIKGSKQAKEQKGLVVKPNIQNIDYKEHRGQIGSPSESYSSPKLLRSEVYLKEHQVQGLTWLMHLWSKSPTDCRGALLADDMGLGKTLQLLTFMACVLEQNPETDPFLVVAPVSLLENWNEEISRFFEPEAFRVLTLYGESLASKRLPKEVVDQELAEQGITKLLRRDWLGGANLVLTTYETLRDLEFSLALQRWSAIICDEAQKIKNPNAMVTRAAKKQNARFKIACTGTPVENTLVDLWCLFDYIQPGLLGALKDFGNRYRRPIEADTDEEKERVEELRTIIDQQKLRRTKSEVAKDLPQKIEVPECRSLQLSERQRALYADAIGAFRNKKNEGGGRNHLGLLQYLRRLCSDPHPLGILSTDTVPVCEIEKHSPKMAWMIETLSRIQKKQEKVIIFCEFKDLQRTIQRAIAERFGISADIINGETSASSRAANSRQKRIQLFQKRSGFGAIILSPLAVGFGVNIQAANHVIHFTRTWNPAKEDQATDRAYRIGQIRDVYVYYPVVVAEDFMTFDAKLDELLSWKRSLSADMLNGTGEISPSEFGNLGSPGGGNAFGDEFITRSDIEAMDGQTFEAFCSILWSKLGFWKIRRTPKSGDGGVDVVAIAGQTGVLIQCKSSSVAGRELGWEAVKDVTAGAAGYAARYPGVTFSLKAVTNSKFNSVAKTQAALNHVELIDLEGLSEKLHQKPVQWSELTSHLFEGWL